MGNTRFMISEAAKKVQVESHVLRYWEDELGIKIGRTEMGHRYYTEDDIQLFCCIKKLKNEGMLLRDLKPLIPELQATKMKMQENTTGQKKSSVTPSQAASTSIKTSDNVISSVSVSGTSDSSAPEKTDLKASEKKEHNKANPIESASTELKPVTASGVSSVPDTVSSTPEPADVITVTQLEQVRSLIGDVLTEVVTDNNEVLKKDISKSVTTDVMREMDFLFQAKERREEEHFRKLDSLIRQQQASRRESVKGNPLLKLKKILT